MPLLSPRDRALTIALGSSLLLDQLTKLAIVLTLREGVDEVVLIDGWLSLVHVRNHAAAFGATGDLPVPARRALYAITTVAMLAGVAIVRRLVPTTDRLAGVMMGLAVGGVLGNAIDRVVRGSVVDMVQMTAGHPTLAAPLTRWLGSPTWPVYNVADVVLLAALLALAGWLVAPDEPTADPNLDPSG